MVTTPSKRAPATPSFDVPDLDLGPLQPVRSPAARSHATRPQSGAHQIRARATSPADSAEDFDLDLEPAEALELEGNSPPPRSRQGRPPASYGTLASVDDDFELDEAMAVEPVAAPLDTKPWPRGRTNDAKQSTLTPEVIVEYAAYGKGSPPFYLAPAYAWRVWNRRQELAHQLEFQQGELSARQSERDRLLVDLAQSLAADLEKQDRFHDLLAQLSAAKRALEGQEQVLATTNAAISQAVGVHDGELTRLEAERGERAKVVAKCRRERDAKAADQQRASAKLKRVQIEIRNATEKGRAIVGAGGGALPSELARQLAELEETQASLLREVEQCDGQFETADQALQASEQPLAETEGHIQAIVAQKSATVESTRATVENEVSQTRTAKATYTEVAKRIALAVLDLKGGIPVDRIILDRIQGADDRVEAHEIELEKLTLALTAYDHGSYGLGIKLALTPFVLAIALLLLRGLL